MRWVKSPAARWRRPSPKLVETMRWLGPELGLFAQKSTVGVAMLACAVYARRMLTQPDRAWLATAPLYVGAVGQTLAAASWVILGYVLYL